MPCNLKQTTYLNHVRECYPEARSFADDCVLTLVNGDEHRGIIQEFKIPMTSVRDMLSFIGFENAPFPAMLGALSIVQSLFYPAGNEHLGKPILAHYGQREWRVTAGYSVNGQRRGVPLSLNEHKSKRMAISARVRSNSRIRSSAARTRQSPWHYRLPKTSDP